MTALLLGGQVLPFVLLAFAPMLSAPGLTLAGLAAVFAGLPRIIANRKFGQPPASFLLHPLGIFALLVIQWHALLRHLAGQPAVWKGRAYLPVVAVESAKAAG